MKRFLPRIAAFSLVVATASFAFAEPKPWNADSVLDDPHWRKSFLGSYGFLSGAEPDIAPGELALLREVIELMKANPRAAAARLSGEVHADSSAALDFVLANLEFQTGQLDSAAAHYRSALEKFPDFRRAHKNLGLLLVQKSDCQSALGHLSKAVELGDRDARNYGLLGYCYIQSEHYLAAEAAYREAVLQQPDTKDWKLGLARALLGMKKYEEAAALFQSVLDADPGNVTAWMHQANAYLGLDRPLEAAVDLETVRALGKAQPSSLKLLGDIYMNAGMPDLAANAYREVIQSDPAGAQFDTAARAAELMIRTQAYGEASKILDSIDARYGKKLDEDQELRVLTLKAKLARAQGHKREAAKLLESVVHRDGTRGDALLELASYYREQGDKERALLMIERAERLESHKYPALLEHAQFMVSERDYPRAAELLRDALEIKTEPRVQAFLARVEEAARRSPGS